MRNLLDYHQRAVECRAAAEYLKDPAARESLLALAESWEELALSRAQAMSDAGGRGRGPAPPEITI